MFDDADHGVHPHNIATAGGQGGSIPCDQSGNEIVLVVCSSACQFAPCSANCLPRGAVFRTGAFESLRKFPRSDGTQFTAGELRRRHQEKREGRPSRDCLNRRTSDRRLDRQAISDEFAAVENLQELAAGKATIFAVGPALE